MKQYENSMVVGATADYERQFPEMTADELKVLEAAAADEITEPDYWRGVEIDSETALRLAYVMQNLDRAINGDAISVQAVLGGLSRIQTHHVAMIVEDER